MIRPTAVKVKAKDNYLLEILFTNNELRIFDVKPYIKGEWYGELKDPEYFNTVKTDGITVQWKHGQDICPDELYELSTCLG